MILSHKLDAHVGPISQGPMLKINFIVYHAAECLENALIIFTSSNYKFISYTQPFYSADSLRQIPIAKIVWEKWPGAVQYIQNSYSVWWSSKLIPPIIQLYCLKILDGRANISRVPDPKDNSNNKHRHRIKYIKCPLMSQRIATLALNILHNTEDRSRKDQSADNINHIKGLFPRCIRSIRIPRRLLPQPYLEDNSRDKEQSQQNNLNK